MARANIGNSGSAVINDNTLTLERVFSFPNQAGTIVVVPTNIGSAFIISAGSTFVSHGTTAVLADLGVNIFQTIVVSGQSDVVADSSNDTLTLAAGSNVTITTNAGTDTITIASTGGSGTSGSAFADWVGAGEGAVPNAGGAVLGKFGTTYVLNTLDYDPTNKTRASFYRKIPNGLTIATTTIDIHWFASTAVTVGTSDNAIWDVEIRTISAGEGIDTTASPASSTTTITGTTTANGTVAISTGSLTTTGWAAGDLMLINLERNPANTTDDLSGTASLIGFYLRMQ